MNDPRVFDAARRLTTAVHPAIPFPRSRLWLHGVCEIFPIFQPWHHPYYLTGYVLMAASPDLASFVPLLSGIPDDDKFWRGKYPLESEIGKSPYLWASRFRSSEVRMNSEKCENEESFSPR